MMWAVWILLGLLGSFAFVLFIAACIRAGNGGS